MVAHLLWDGTGNVAAQMRSDQVDNLPRRRVTSAVGLGLGVVGVGLTLADLYKRPSIAVASVIAGLGLTLAHWPWPKTDSP